MAQLSTKVNLYCKANNKSVDFGSEGNVSLQDDGNGAYIKTWEVLGLAQPTNTDLISFEAEANTKELLNKVIENRKKEYPSIEELVVALYDTEDKLALENKRTAVKLKYPKENS